MTTMIGTGPIGAFADAAAQMVLQESTPHPDHTVEAVLVARDRVEAAVREQTDEALRARLASTAMTLGLELQTEEAATFVNLLNAVRRRYGGAVLARLVRAARS
jgi:hypothetical protein